MLISPLELLYMLITTLVIAYIFMDFIKLPNLNLYNKKFDWDNFKFAALVAAPGIILHELSHKFVAMGFGYEAVFQMWAFGLFIGIFLKWIKSPFLIIAPGYVLINSLQTNYQISIIAFAGPAINLVLWLGSWAILNNAKNLKRKTALFLYLTKQINMILFIFNMIPIPPLDGSKVLQGIISLF
ncbi:MAG: M50 family metallopeptidase [Nanoarchaeota archaeon]|nr:M50 family metallopeptidase [Nanoarchaeota archaeon]MBU0963054.1 M50 family metallopeptidase [Nanoarchaeota archaeon]